MVKTFSTVSGNHPESLSRHSDSCQRWCLDTSSLSSGVTQQQQAFRFSSTREEALRLTCHRRSRGYLVTGLLQSPVSGSQSRRNLLTNHRSQEIESISGNTFVQDGYSFHNNSSSAATGMDHQDRPKGRLSSCPGPCEHPEVLSLCYSWKDLSVLCASVWSFDSTHKVHKDFGPISSAASQQRDQSPCISQRLDHPCGFPRTESSAYATDYPALQTLGWAINWNKSIPEHSRILDFLGLHFNVEHAIVSPTDSFLNSLSCVLSHLSASTVMPARNITIINSWISHYAPFIHHECLHLRFLKFWIKRCWSQHTQPWPTMIQLDSEFLTHLRWLNRREVLQGVPLHLPKPTLFILTDASLTGWGAS